MPESMEAPPRLRPRAEEMLLGRSDEHVRETYIFEPSAGEEAFGYLLAAGQTWASDGFGVDLLEAVVSAIQKEYYRDPSRKSSTSFEMALHQANLILHDMAEQGARDWMQCFDVAVGVLVGNTLHISVAGQGRVFIMRGGQLNDVSQDLGQSPITNPLQSFSQVASGSIMKGDVLMFTTDIFEQLYRPSQVLHFGSNGAAETLVQKLTHWYEGEGHHAAVALVAASVVAEHEPESVVARAPHSREKREPKLQPRQPLVIRRIDPQQVMRFFTHAPAASWQWLSSKWQRGESNKEPHTESGPAKKKRISFRERGLRLVMKAWQLPSRLPALFAGLPISSKIFAVLSLLLLIALGSSVWFLREKRASDADIEAASEILHDARLRKEAAQTALIYDNREQAKGLLSEAEVLIEKLNQTGLYQEEGSALAAEITESLDQLQRITRSNEANTKVVGDFTDSVNSDMLQNIFLLDDWLYTYDPRTNTIVRMNKEGQVEISHKETKEVGFFRDGAAYKPDKMLTFLTDPAGLAVFDARDQSLNAQSITLPNTVTSITDMALYGNRLYLSDGDSGSILSFNKTLRGYSGGFDWLVGEKKPDSIASLAVDGNIYTLHKNGQIRRWFKGSEVDFEMESVDPPLPDTAKLLTADDLQYLYVIDREERRVVVFTKKGALVRQLFFDEETPVSDIAVPQEEDRLYLLAGTQVLEVQLVTP